MVVQTRGRVDGVAEDPLELMDAAVAAALGSHPVEVHHHGRVLEQGRQPPVAVPASIALPNGAGRILRQVMRWAARWVAARVQPSIFSRSARSLM